MLLLIIIAIIRSFKTRKQNNLVVMFIEALREENEGHFEAAVANYEKALKEAKKTRFPNNTLKNKISEKLKILHTAIAYQNNFHLGR